MRTVEYKKGFTLLEVVVSTAVFLIVVPALTTTFVSSLKSSLSNTTKVQASFLGEEGLEAVRILRDNGWSANIAPQASGSNFYLTFGGTTWSTTTANVYVNGMFERRLQLTDVYRDGAQNIVLGGGTLDVNTKKVKVFVSWFSGSGTTTKSLETLLTNIFKN